MMTRCARVFTLMFFCRILYERHFTGMADPLRLLKHGNFARPALLARDYLQITGEHTSNDHRKPLQEDADIERDVKFPGVSFHRCPEVAANLPQGVRISHVESDHWLFNK